MKLYLKRIHKTEHEKLETLYFFNRYRNAYNSINSSMQ
jgi:hypothetical protein